MDTRYWKTIEIALAGPRKKKKKTTRMKWQGTRRSSNGNVSTPAMSLPLKAYPCELSARVDVPRKVQRVTVPEPRSSRPHSSPPYLRQCVTESKVVERRRVVVTVRSIQLVTRADDPPPILAASRGASGARGEENGAGSARGRPDLSYNLDGYDR